MFKKYKIPRWDDGRAEMHKHLSEVVSKEMKELDEEFARAKRDPEYARYLKLRSDLKIKHNDPDYEPLRGFDYPAWDFLFLLDEEQ